MSRVGKKALSNIEDSCAETSAQSLCARWPHRCKYRL